MTSIEVEKEILDYWALLEFLNQKNIGFIEEVKPSKHMSITVNCKVNQNQDLFEMIQQHANVYKEQPRVSDHIEVIMGTIKREQCMQAIYQLSGKKDERIERSVGNIALFGLKVTSSKQYVLSSFHLSPMIWTISKLHQFPNRDLTQIIDLASYQNDISEIEQELRKCNEVNQTTLHEFYDQLCKKYLHNLPCSLHAIKEGSISYQRFKDEDSMEKRMFSSGYATLKFDFYDQDIQQVKKNLLDGKLYETTYGIDFLLSYVSCAYDQQNQSTNRINILQESSESKAVLKEVLHIDHAPLGKWPSRYTPALMQQFAINRAIKDSSDMISVNGPPGTGKTTLLKEIVADAVVKRAVLMCEYENADDAFQEACYQDGTCRNNGYSDDFSKYYKVDDTLNAYAILVASNNNAAVENITKELPDGKALCSAIKPNGDETENEQSLSSIYDLFKEQKQDIYFSEYANQLFNDQKSKKYYWGFISAPLGKKENQTAVTSILYDILKNEFSHKHDVKHIKEHKENFMQAKIKLKEQLKKVEAIQERLRQACDAEKTYESYVDEQRLNIEALKQDTLKHEAAIEHHRDTIHQQREDLKQLSTLLQEANQSSHEKQKLAESKKMELDNTHQAIDDMKNNIMELEKKRTWKHYVCFILRMKTMLEIEIQKHYQTYETLEQNIVHVQEEVENANHQYADALRIHDDIQADMKHKNEMIQQGLTNIEQLETKMHENNEAISNITIQQKNAEKTYVAWTRSLQKKKDDMTSFDGLHEQFWNAFYSDQLEATTKAHVMIPWMNDEFHREREKLFYYALQVNKEFLLTSTRVKSNIRNLLMIWTHTANGKGIHFSDRDQCAAYPYLIQTLFLLTPVISTTFASIGTFLKSMKEPFQLGTLIVDEAGQAQPHMALGAMLRCRKAIIVGDPKQIEPVVSDELYAIKHLLRNKVRAPYNNKQLSVQSFSDVLNPYGTYFENKQDEATWVGCPLVVHRRCISPMFEISNEISYNNIMKKQTQDPNPSLVTSFVIPHSHWKNIKNPVADAISHDNNLQGKKDHYVKEQGIAAIQMIKAAFEQTQEGWPSLYIISPFNSVILGLKAALKQQSFYANDKKRLDDWMKECVDTVHKFQGKEANEVIFLLGCGQNSEGAVKWVNANIINVAVTRAKYRLCIIGDVQMWSKNDNMNVVIGIMDAYLIGVLKTFESQVEAGNAQQAVHLDTMIKDNSSLLHDEHSESYAPSLIKGMEILDPKGNYHELTAKELNTHHLDKEDLDSMSDQVRNFLIAAIKVYTDLLPVYTKYEDMEMDRSCLCILFCKALELHVRDCFIDSLKRCFPDHTLHGTVIIKGAQNSRSRIEQLSAHQFMLGSTAKFLNGVVSELDKFTHDTYLDQTWWDTYTESLIEAGKIRNTCCHAESCDKKDSSRLLQLMFEQRVFLDTAKGKLLNDCEKVTI